MCMCVRVCVRAVYVHVCCTRVLVCAHVSWRAKKIINIFVIQDKKFRGPNPGEVPKHYFLTLGRSFGRWQPLEQEQEWGWHAHECLRSSFMCLKYTQAVDSLKILTCSPNRFPFQLKKKMAWWKRDRKNFRWKQWEVPLKKRFQGQNITGPQKISWTENQGSLVF